MNGEIMNKYIAYLNEFDSSFLAKVYITANNVIQTNDKTLKVDNVTIEFDSDVEFERIDKKIMRSNSKLILRKE
jgi:hypothetical protein